MYYNNDLLLKLKKDRLVALIISTIVLVISLGLCTLLCFFATKENQSIILLLNTIITTLFLWSVIFLYDTKISINNRKIKHFKTMLSATYKEYIGKVEAIGKSITLFNKVVGKEVLINVEDKILCFYLLEDFEVNFEVDDLLKVKTAQKFIVSVEVDHD